LCRLKTNIYKKTKCLVTGGADATTADIAESTDKKYVTDAQQTSLASLTGTKTAIGSEAGRVGQGESAVAIGLLSGEKEQGRLAVAFIF
jgi:hypothetical protein